MKEAGSLIETPLMDQWACQQQLLIFMQLMDAGNADAAAALLTLDARWDRQGQIIEGPQAIAAVIAGRSAERIVRHHLCNLVVTLEPPDRASLRAYYSAYICDRRAGTHSSGFPEPSGDYFADFVRTEAGWRISYLRAHRLFERPARGIDRH